NNGVIGGDVTVTGLLQNGGTSTASALSKAGVGLVTLDPTAVNNYGGTTTVSAGNLRVANTSGFGNSALGTVTSEQQTFTINGNAGGGSFTINSPAAGAANTTP